MVYLPITEEKKEDWINYLNSLKERLNNKPEDPNANHILNGEFGDVADTKDLVGNLLALLLNKPVEIL